MNWYKDCIPFLTSDGKEVRIMKILANNFQKENDRINKELRELIDKYGTSLCSSELAHMLFYKCDLDFCEIKEDGKITKTLSKEQ